ncbi:MAG: recombinase family protein [Phycisphaerae bacterium]|nr:recombinase family protein [Phycisphaerae bacterium]
MSERIFRCAVYTRKSSEEGLEQAFNSLDAQREAGIDYIKSQKHQGWVALPARYDDGGYSGGSMDRPGLQRLLADIQSRRVDVVVVYKVDRLSRSLADFARLMQTFDEHQVSFVSVTQQFNTTTSMGRLTLNMLLSFAQFEREVTGERIRDKIAATKRKGIWIGGIPPIGYRLPQEDDIGHTPGDRTLRVIEPEAAIVRSIFEGYIETGSLVTLAKRLDKAGHTTKRWSSAQCMAHGGRRLTTTQLYRILNNPIYLGKITHTRGDKTEVYDSTHIPIVSRTLWDKAHARMERIEYEARHRWTHTHLLKGKIRTCEDFAMSPGSVHKVTKQADSSSGSRLTRYYTSQKALKEGYANCPVKSINAGHLDDLVRAIVMDHVKEVHGVDLRSQLPEKRDRWIRDSIHQVTLAPDRLTIEIERDCLRAVASEIKATKVTTSKNRPRERPRNDENGNSVDGKASVPMCSYKPEVDESGPRTTLSIRIQMKRLDGRRVLVSPDGDDLLLKLSSEGVPIPKEHFVRAIGQAFSWLRELSKSSISLADYCRRKGLAYTRADEILSLTNLSPKILHAALVGELQSAVRLDDLLAAAKHFDWTKQHELLRLA